MRVSDAGTPAPSFEAPVFGAPILLLAPNNCQWPTSPFEAPAGHLRMRSEKAWQPPLRIILSAAISKAPHPEVRRPEAGASKDAPQRCSLHAPNAGTPASPLRHLQGT
ncbi:hypothetical protein AMC82_CH00565 [Rhizobium phaseoli]|nr:hypothetical protein AMC88_CH00572 [Rhizobium phaseoli]ANL58000.1 hypothetical protein AMC85_CH00572 [Rhizobium phaseoli]ANL64264.1 hypothetical protein AMC84_CH00567 [Rhizobium phaseoli]ANL70629.1 hypothetical protein AMC83_CH00598 [Rhizobium phaseoli]ANL77079.1 hypothetical protein AMC82_CH00565 [Rhizobium phaseoli]